jgi:formylglycine-generating enzyme required for sulfatase activity
MKSQVTVLAIVVAVVLTVASAQAVDVFNMPTGQTSMAFVTVGDPGNAADPSTGYGAVPYTYQMGKYDVTVGQYTQFLNAVAQTDTYGLYNSTMATFYPTVAITQSGSPGSYSYAITGGYNGSYTAAANCPVFAVTWGDAARFCNWLQNGQPVGAEGTGTTENGAYTLNGATTTSALMAITRNAGATDFIPSEDEWYKAAYYKGGSTKAGYWLYATQSNTAPSNVLSPTGMNNANYYSGGYSDPTNHLTPVGAFAASPGPYGTYDMSGNLWQWNEANISSSLRGLRGGDCNLDSSYLTALYRSYNSSPADGWSTVGFRVASEAVPEPSSVVMLFAGAAACFMWRRARMLRHG